MKKVLFVYFHTSGAVVPDTNVFAVGQDSIALAEVFNNTGHEVWVLEPYKLKSKQCNWPLKIHLNEIDKIADFDIIIGFLLQIHFNILTGSFLSYIEKYQSMKDIIDAVYEACVIGDIPLMTPVYDPKPKFMQAISSSLCKKTDIRPGRGNKEYLNKYLNLCDITQPIWSSRDMLTNLPIFEYIKSRQNWYSNHFEHFFKYIGSEYKESFNFNYKYQIVYTGFIITEYRAARMIHLLSKAYGLHHAGMNLKMAKPLKSTGLYNNKTLTKAQDNEVMADSRFIIAFAEKAHTFITQRVYQGAFSGNILLVDFEYTAASDLMLKAGLSEHILIEPQDIVKWQTKSDEELAEIYLNQIEKLKPLLLYERPFVFEPLATS